MTDKEKAKLEKRLKKEKIAKEKLNKRLEKAAAKKHKSGKVTVSKTTKADWTDDQETNAQEPEQKDTWVSRFLEKHKVKKNLYDRRDIKRGKDEKEKTDYKLAFKEFPVKMVKEVSKIKWAGKKELTSKFIQVVIFMVVTAAFFYFIDWIFKVIFTAIHVI